MAAKFFMVSTSGLCGKRREVAAKWCVVIPLPKTLFVPSVASSPTLRHCISGQPIDSEGRVRVGATRAGTVFRLPMLTVATSRCPAKFSAAAAAKQSLAQPRRQSAEKAAVSQADPLTGPEALYATLPCYLTAIQETQFNESRLGGVML